MAIVRSIASVILALILAFLGVIGVEWMSSILHPFPPGFDQTSMEAMCEHVARYPPLVLLLCAVGWWLTVLASCWLATRIGARRHAAHGIVVGVILLGMAILNMSLLPYPLWFWMNVIIFPACCALGTWWAQKSIVPPNSSSS